MPQRNCCSRSRGHHPSAQERPTLETNQGGCHRAKRSRAGLQISWAGTLVKADLLSPPQPPRDENELFKTTRRRPHGKGLRPAGYGTPSPNCGAQSQLRPWHTNHQVLRVSPSGNRGSPFKHRFEQQSRLEAKISVGSLSHPTDTVGRPLRRWVDVAAPDALSYDPTAF